MLPGKKRVSTRVKPVVMPSIEAWPTASKAPRHLEPVPSSRLDVTPGDVKAMASLRDAPYPTQASDADKPATAPLPANDKPVQAAGYKPATAAAPTVQLEAPT
ncbi:MAG: hypothetical protein ACXWKQ_05670, partial [Reyranella sp.]